MTLEGLILQGSHDCEGVMGEQGFNSPRLHHLEVQDGTSQIVSPATYTGIKRTVGVERVP